MQFSLLQEPQALSVFISLMTKFYNILKVTVLFKHNKLKLRPCTCIWVSFENIEFVYWKYWVCILRILSMYIENIEYLYWEYWVCILRILSMYIENIEYVYWEYWVCILRILSNLRKYYRASLSVYKEYNEHEIIFITRLFHMYRAAGRDSTIVACLILSYINVVLYKDTCIGYVT